MSYFSPAPAAPIVNQVAERSFLRLVFAWMFLAMVITTGVAAYFSADDGLMNYISAHPGTMWALFAAQIGMVVALSWGASRMNATVAATLFAVYAATVGVTFAIIIQFYTTASIVGAFAGAAGVFGGMAVYGYTTQRNLGSLSGLLFGILIGFFAATIVYVFVGGTVFNLILGLVGVVLFAALTAHDMQQLKLTAAQAVDHAGEVDQRMVIVGALSLYLNFLNLVISMLRIFGSGR